MFHRREDYIVKLLATLSVIAAKVLQLRLKSQHKEAIAVLESASDQFGLSGLEHLNIDAVLKLLDTGSIRDTLKGLLLATLLAERAEIYAEQNLTDEAHDCNVKAFKLFYHLLYVRDSAALQDELSAEDWHVQHARLRSVADRLDYFSQPLDVGYELMVYYEATQQYDKAENVLFALLEQTDYHTETAALGISFYERLLSQDDATLINGNLPRHEIEESLREIQVNL